MRAHINNTYENPKHHAWHVEGALLVMLFLLGSLAELHIMPGLGEGKGQLRK